MNTTTNTRNANDFDANANLNTMPVTDKDAGKDSMKDTDADMKGDADNKVDPNAKMGAADMVTADGQDMNMDANATMKKDQLHRRVMARISEIEKELSNLQGSAKDSEHAKALQNEITLANDAMSGGWERVGEVEAARLSQWLDTSQNLLVAKTDPANGEPMNTRLPADGAVATDGKAEAAKNMS